MLWNLSRWILGGGASIYIYVCKNACVRHQNLGVDCFGRGAQQLGRDGALSSLLVPVVSDAQVEVPASHPKAEPTWCLKRLMRDSTRSGRFFYYSRQVLERWYSFLKFA